MNNDIIMNVITKLICCNCTCMVTYIVAIVTHVQFFIVLLSKARCKMVLMKRSPCLSCEYIYIHIAIAVEVLYSP